MNNKRKNTFVTVFSIILVIVLVTGVVYLIVGNFADEVKKTAEQVDHDTNHDSTENLDDSEYSYDHETDDSNPDIPDDSEDTIIYPSDVNDSTSLKDDENQDSGSSDVNETRVFDLNCGSEDLSLTLELPRRSTIAESESYVGTKVIENSEFKLIFAHVPHNFSPKWETYG